MFKAIEALSKRFDSLGKNMERKLDLVNVNVMNMSGRTSVLERKGMTLSHQSSLMTSFSTQLNLY